MADDEPAAKKARRNRWDASAEAPAPDPTAAATAAAAAAAAAAVAARRSAGAPALDRGDRRVGPVGARRRGSAPAALGTPSRAANARAG